MKTKVTYIGYTEVDKPAQARYPAMKAGNLVTLWGYVDVEDSVAEKLSIGDEFTVEIILG